MDDATDYDRGKALGHSIQAERAAGGNPDVRWELADEAKSNRDFNEFMRGLNDAFKED